MFYENLQLICSQNNTTPTAVVKALKLSTGNVTNWKKGGYPKGDVLVQLSELLNVSCDYLLKGTVACPQMPQDEELLLKWYRSMNKDGKDYILQTLDMAKERYKKGASVSAMENIS